MLYKDTINKLIDLNRIPTKWNWHWLHFRTCSWRYSIRSFDQSHINTRILTTEMPHTKFLTKLQMKKQESTRNLTQI